MYEEQENSYEKGRSTQGLRRKFTMEPEEVDEIHNEYFALVFTTEKDVVDGESQEGYIDILEHISIKKEEMSSVLKSIKVDNPPGPDGIYPRMPWEMREEIVGPLYEIFESSLIRGEEVEKMIDKDWVVDVVYMDFSNVFDKVPHGRLRQKVKSHGIHHKQ
eukprot:g34581.t1